MGNRFPAILIHGLFGHGPDELEGLPYWTAALSVPTPLPRFTASVGPISSNHDRACELAAQIKGTRVDYGAEHARAHGHARYGRDYQHRGFVPDWDQSRPVHLIGHSMGAATARALQHLLAEDAWGWGSNEAWIASIHSISGALNGSTALYAFGVSEDTGLVPKRSGLAPLLRLLEVYTAFDDQGLDRLYDFDLDQWGYARGNDESLLAYLERIAESGFLWGSDNAFYDTSLQGGFRANGRWQTYTGTFYSATSTEATFRYHPAGYQYPSPLMNPALQPTAAYVGRKVFDQPPFPDSGFNSGDWWVNDGLLSSYSQAFPRTNGLHPTSASPWSATQPEVAEAGRWYTQKLSGLDHGALVAAARWWQRGRQQAYFTHLFHYLAGLPA